MSLVRKKLELDSHLEIVYRRQGHLEQQTTCRQVEVPSWEETAEISVYVS